MRVLITGGAGFIGSNAAVDFLHRGDEVTILDDLSRAGTPENLAWVQSQGAVSFIRADVRDAAALRRALERPLDAVLHLAAQVAVTTSVTDPRTDFEINALGTFNMLEAVRRCSAPPVVVYASTNKVYGGLEDLQGEVVGQRYVCAASSSGIDERRPLDFHSPYGCSKGAADQYVRDYARIYGLRTLVLRQSCIYGTRQFGIEDQGWLAWFAIAALLGRSVTIYGDGCQVRDVLEVSDLVRLYRRCLERPEAASGQVLNVGGGPANVLSILEALELLEEELGASIPRRFAPWRPGDQKLFISNNGEAHRHLGWRPEVGVREGLPRLVAWIRSSLDLIARLVG
jgi:CDP-paratose 2-epimerase